MRLLWLMGSTIVSKTIVAFTGDDCSHFAFEFQSDNREGLVFQFDLLGASPQFLGKVLDTHKIVHEKSWDLSDSEEDIAWDACVSQYAKSKYNFDGAYYLGYRKWLFNHFKVPVPETNAWSKSGRDFCSQAYDILQKIPRMPKINTAMKTPGDLWEILK